MVARFAHFAKRTLRPAGQAAVVGALVVLGAGLAGCRAPDCQRMQACCEAIADEPGVGEACGDIASNVRDPETCRTITRTVRYMYDERDAEPPAVCLADDPAAGSKATP